MTEEIIDSRNRRRPWLAVVLSVIVPGLGHLYCGKIVRSLVLTFLFGLLSNLILACIVFFSPLKAAVFSALFLVYFALWLILVIDAYIVSRGIKRDYELKDYNRIIVYALWAITITGGSIMGKLHFRAKFLEAFRVPAASCYPAIIPGDRILANKLVYRNADPQRGENIIFINPENRHMKIIKRIIAVEGDTVEIKEGELYVNDQKLLLEKLPAEELDKIQIEIQGTLLKGDLYRETNGQVQYDIFLAYPPHAEPQRDLAKVTVPANHCFVLGDNRNNSYDSRHFGPVSLSTLIGRADFLYWPGKDFSRFGSLNSQ